MQCVLCDVYYVICISLCIVYHVLCAACLYPEYRSIMVEGGAGIISSFLAGGGEVPRIDLVIVTIALILVCP